MKQLKDIQRLVQGQIFTLTEEDKKVGSSTKKSKQAKFGLAIDNHIKELIKPMAALIPENKFAPYDFDLDGCICDIKSYSAGSVTVSVNEYAFAYERMRNGNDTYYIVFEQGDSDTFKYSGICSFKELVAHNKFRQSRFENGGYYFSPALSETV